MEVDDVGSEDLVSAHHAQHVLEMQRAWLRIVPVHLRHNDGVNSAQKPDGWMGAK